MSYHKYFNFIDDQIGLQLASVALLILALTPIFFGSITSLNTLKEPHYTPTNTRLTRGKSNASSETHHDDNEEEDNRTQVINIKDAFLFPIIGSALLYFTYLTLDTVSPQYVDKSIQVITSILSCTVLSKAAMMVLNNKLPRKVSKSLEKYKLSVSKKDQKLYHVSVNAVHLSVLAVSIALVVAYSITEHWVLGNLFAISLAISCIGTFSIDSFMTGFFLLSGMLSYDLFWLFGTNIMLSISNALSHAPVTIVWPRNINTYVFDKLLMSDQYFTSFGLGDIIVPGIYIAYCLRFDRLNSWKKQKNGGDFSSIQFPKPYFAAAIFAYTLSAAASIYTVHYTKKTQSALLFIVPALIASTVGTAVARDEVRSIGACDDVLKTVSKLSSFSVEDEEEEERPTRFSKRSSTSEREEKSKSTTRGRSTSVRGRRGGSHGRSKSKGPNSRSKSKDVTKTKAKDTAKAVKKAKDTVVDKAKEFVPDDLQDKIQAKVEDVVEEVEDVAEQAQEAVTPKKATRSKRSSSRVAKKK